MEAQIKRVQERKRRAKGGGERETGWREKEEGRREPRAPGAAAVSSTAPDPMLPSRVCSGTEPNIKREQVRRRLCPLVCRRLSERVWPAASTTKTNEDSHNGLFLACALERERAVCDFRGKKMKLKKMHLFVFASSLPRPKTTPT